MFRHYYQVKTNKLYRFMAWELLFAMDCTCGLLIRICNFFLRGYGDRKNDRVFSDYDFNVTFSGNPVASPMGDVIDDG